MVAGVKYQARGSKLEVWQFTRGVVARVWRAGMS